MFWSSRYPVYYVKYTQNCWHCFVTFISISPSMVIIKMNFLSCFRKNTKKKYWFADNILCPLCFLYSVDDLISFIVLALDELR